MIILPITSYWTCNNSGTSLLQTRTKFVCTVLSLPVPPNSQNSPGEEVSGVIPASIVQKSIHKLFLVGYNKSGSGTIYKQVGFCGGNYFNFETVL